jgi:hypothetical protein
VEGFGRKESCLGVDFSHTGLLEDGSQLKNIDMNVNKEIKIAMPKHILINHT